HSRLAKKGFDDAILRVLALEKATKRIVVCRALISPVGRGVVTQVQLPAPAVRSVRTGAMRREPAENRHVARFQDKLHASALGDRIQRELVEFTVFRRETAPVMATGKDFETAVFGTGGVDRHEHRQKAA